MYKFLTVSRIDGRTNYSHPWEGRWFCNPFWIGLTSSHFTIISSSGLNSLKWAIVPSSSTSSMTWSSLATVSTSNEANAANGRASANSKLVMAILLNVGLSILLSAAASLFFNSSEAELSVLTLGKAVFWGRRLVVGWRKRRGWAFKAISRSCRAWWRWSERIEGEQWCRFLMLLASSFRTIETSTARRMQGSLNRARTAFGVYDWEKWYIIQTWQNYSNSM